MSRLDDLSRFTSKAVNEIDASIFSGDEFLDVKAREALRFYIARWSNALDEHEAVDNMNLDDLGGEE
jgi:hypothetical protein